MEELLQVQNSLSTQTFPFPHLVTTTVRRRGRMRRLQERRRRRAYMHMLAVESRVLPQTEKRHRHHRNKTWKLANRPFSTSFPFPGNESKTHDREAKLAKTLTRTTSSISSLLLDRNCVVFVGTASPGAKLLCLHRRDPKTHLSRKP